MLKRAKGKWLVTAVMLLGALAVPGVAQAAAPTCSDMHVGVPHNAATPIFVDCTGGSGIGSPDVLVVSTPSKGTLDLGAGETSTDQWVTYTPDPGQSGADSFTFRGSSAGPGDTVELSSLKTVRLRIGEGTPPVCAGLSASVPQNDATHTTATSLRLVCASGGDPITGFAITSEPANGTLSKGSLGDGLV